MTSIKSFFGIILFFLFTQAQSQINNIQDSINSKLNTPNKKNGGNKNIESFLSIGVISGKVINEKTNKPISNVSILVFAEKVDTSTKKRQEKLLQSLQTSTNGEFNIEGLPVMQRIKLQFLSNEFSTINKVISFNFSIKDMQSGGRDMSQLINAASKDLGIIGMVEKANKEELDEVVVNSQKMSSMGTQVFNVDKNMVAAGATAQELLKTIPMVSVDIEGNVTVRNASPQIYVDGKPSSLSLDQIPADLVERVEVMTNPSSKYDSEGQGGILNIVLKRSKKLGFNGMLMLGSYLHMKPYEKDIDLYHYNGGLILNLRKNKVNMFVNALTFKRKMHSIGQTNRTFVDNTASPNFLNNMVQDNINLGQGNMYILRTGLDYFITNNSTLSADVNIMNGFFTPWNNLTQNNIFNSGLTNIKTRNLNSDTKFKNIRGSIGYKRTFEKQGKEFTTTLFYNIRDVNVYNTFQFETIDPAVQTFAPNYLLQQNHFLSGSDNYRLQMDYTNPISEEKKIEMGININYSNTPFDNNYYNLNLDKSKSTTLTKTKYNYSDLNVAGYASYSQNIKNLSIQAGLRIEQFFYAGTLYNADDSKNDYLFTMPFNVFPSIFITQKWQEKNSVQFSYTMRINRPSIFNLIPFIDYTDSTNLRKGDPSLKPEKIHVAELNYQYTTKNNYILLALYGKYTDNVITQFQKTDSTNPSKRILINTYINSEYALNYGFETVIKNSFLNNKIEFTSNVNIYNTLLNGGTEHKEIEGQRWSFYAKETINLKFPFGISFQTFIEYQHSTLVPPSSGNRSSGDQQPGGRPAYLSSPTSTSQGFIRPNFGVDIALKKEFLKGFITLTLAGTDVFETRKYNAYTYSNAFYQNSWSIRNQSLYYLSMNVRLGKMDINVMKKKNIKAEKENMQGGGDAF